MAEASKVYLARAGKSGEDEEVALDEGMAVVGFTEIPSLEACKDYDAIYALVEKSLPGAKTRAVGNFAGQLWAFVLAMKEGDLVVLPRKLTSQIAIGRVTGPYRYKKVRSAFRHTRAVEWIRQDVPRTTFEQDILQSFGAFMTVCNISGNDAERRVAAVAAGRDDPGPASAVWKSKSTGSAEPTTPEPEKAGSLPETPTHEIIQMILDRGRLTKDEIKQVFNISEEAYQSLRARLDHEKLIEPGPPRAGGFIARFNRRPKPADDASVPAPTFKTHHEGKAAERLVELLSHAELEELLGDLVYAIRRARLRQTGEDRRGSKAELAAALLTKHGIDLFAAGDVRYAVAKRGKLKAPARWHAGKASAIRFVEAAGFPVEFAGIPAEEPPEDFEYLEGRVDLHALQDFQVEVQKKLLKTIENRAGRAIVTLPTGGGKTRVAVDTIRDWLTARYRVTPSGAGNVVLWLAHTEELCEQATLCFREVWQGSSNVCPMLLFRFWGGFTRDLQRHQETLLTMQQRPAVLVSTPQRLLNLLDGEVAGGEPILDALNALVGLIVIDEAHRAGAPTYKRLIGAFAKANHEPAIVGLTATPFRNDYVATDPMAGTMELRDLFRTIIEPVAALGEDPRATLQQRGILAKPVFESIKTETRLRPPEGIDTANLTFEAIEKIDFALKLRADRPERRLTVLERMLELCRDPNALIIYFGPTVQDAECMAFLLRQQGIEAAFVSGGTRDVSRRKVIGDFRAGRIQVLCNCEVLTTGFDAPRVTHVVMARPTVSQVLYEQMVGRGLRGRLFGGTETCQIIDLEDNYKAERPELGYKRFRALWGAA